MTRKTLSQEQADLIVHRLMTEPVWDSPTAAELHGDINDDDDAMADLLFRHAGTILPTLSVEDGRKMLHVMERLVDRVEIREGKRGAEAGLLRAQIDELRVATAQASEARFKALGWKAAASAATAELALVVERQVSERVLKSSAALAPVAETRPLPVEAAPSTSFTPSKLAGSGRPAPLFSLMIESFVAEKQRPAENHRPWDMQTTNQFKSTSYLWITIVGDRPVDQYTGVDAQAFRDAMLRMPASHGKGGTRAAVRAVVPAMEAIKRADDKQRAIDARNAILPPGAAREEPVPRLKMKTLKRHFSPLSQMWIYMSRQGLVPRERNIFLGWEYQGVGKGKKKRLPWSTANLDKLLASQWFGEDQRGSDRWWIVLISLFSGLRVEEIVRLRPAFDIANLPPSETCTEVHEQQVACFLIQPHPEPHAWNPKSEAGSRRVPIHSTLLEMGFMELVERRRAEGSYRLFPSFGVRPSSDKLSAKFVRDFSNLKNSLDIGPENTFHSSRHNISTMLRNKRGGDIRELWIDAILGHSGGEEDAGKKREVRQRSVGETDYMHDVDVENLKTTVEAIRYPGVDLSRIMPLTGTA